MTKEIENFATGWTARYAVFLMSDGSPSITEYLQDDESEKDFVQRCRHMVDTGGGYVGEPEFLVRVLVKDRHMERIYENA